MLESTKYYINHLILQISKKGMLVEVYETDNDLPRQDRLSDLPDWVFYSRNAIWLGDNTTDMYGRALEGELIKKELMNAMVRQ
jgi:hypothetical protein